ncbi:MAG: O-antigen ligase family protein [Ignavibacteriales bacterium]|nr:MAG: O-antigen ligase family protein [Ignavibacteriales bacterium]
MRITPGSLVKNIDRLIFIFFLLFLVSLTNSIFVNQVGYFGALLLVLFRFIITKENQFNRTGLELAFVLFIAVEIISAAFSEYPAQAFTNAFKRSLLLPIVYTTAIAAVDLKKAKIFFKVYIGASLISVLIYLYFAYRHFIENLYGLTQSGPSIFQYPITASEIISFTVVFLFAFSLNEKTKFQTKLLLIAGFVLSTVALLSTYKRTGWTGAAFGIFVILLMRKQWKIILGGLLIFMVLLLIEKNESLVTVLDYNDESTKIISQLATEGRASDVYPLGNDNFILSDYQNGLVEIKDSTIVGKIETPSPAIAFTHWKDSFYIAQLIDTRFLVLKKKSEKFEIVNEVVSPGFTTDYKISNGYLYIQDRDSGLTVFRDPDNPADSLRFPGLNKYFSICPDSSGMILRSTNGELHFIRFENFLPVNNSISIIDSGSYDVIHSYSHKILASNKNGLKVFNVTEQGVKLSNELKELNKVYRIYSAGEKVFILTTDQKIVELKIESHNQLSVVNEISIGYIPNSLAYDDGKLYLTKVKSSRLLSIFDPYNVTNITRLALWRGGIEIFKNYPLFGVGDIGIENYYRKYKQPYDKEIQGHLHNNFFHILATLGIIGLSVVCFLFYKIIKINLHIYSSVKNEKFLSSYALGAMGSFSAFLVSGLTELNFGDQEIITLVWFITGLNIAFYKLYSAEVSSLDQK